MSWVPVSGCTATCTTDPVPTVDAAIRRRRWLRLSGALAGTGVAALRAPWTGARGRRRLVVCAAARVLTAAGVRVEVTAPAVAWPRAGAGRGPGHLVVGNHVSWIDDLALLTAVKGVPVARREVGDRPVLGGLARRAGVVLVDRAGIRTLPGTVAQVAVLLRSGTAVTVHPEGTTACGVELGRFRPAFFQAAVDAAAPVCPVAVRYRVHGQVSTAVAGFLGDEPLWRSIARVVAVRGLVVEVHLLPALDPAGADRRELAALAEYAVAAVTEARPPPWWPPTPAGPGCPPAGSPSAGPPSSRPTLEQPVLREHIAVVHEDTARHEPIVTTPSTGGVGMRVAVVVETFRPAVNGVVDSVLRMVDHLAVRGHDPVVVAPSGSGYESRCGAWVDVATVPSRQLPGHRQLSLTRPAGDLTDVLGTLTPDVVLLTSPTGLGLSAGRAAGALGVPSVAVLQDDLSADAEQRRLPGGPAATWRYLRQVHEVADLTLARSTATLAMLARHGIGPVTLWPRGVDLDQFAPWHCDPRLRQSLAPSGELLVGVVARPAVEKRLELLAPLSELPGVRLVVAGDGPQRRQLARRLPHARFLGQLGGAGLGALVASLDLWVHPGAEETSCQAVQEALAAGVPALVAASGGPLDLVRHGQNGWLWAGDDPHLLAATVAGLRDDRAALHAAAARARPSVETRTWGRIGDQLIGHLQHVRATARVH